MKQLKTGMEVEKAKAQTFLQSGNKVDHHEASRFRVRGDFAAIIFWLCFITLSSAAVLDDWCESNWRSVHGAGSIHILTVSCMA